MAHTPGPWEVDGVEIYPVNGHRASDAICTMQPGFLDADAALLAAAPQLAQLLQRLAARFNPIADTGDDALLGEVQVMLTAHGYDV